MSISKLPRGVIEAAYAEYAREYLRSLPLEHFMEATAQATQRKITLESLDLVHARRPEVQVFNELLVQYSRRGQDRPGQIVPDNMVVLHDEAIDADGSYDVPIQPVGPFWVMEYVSKHNKRKDYERSFDKYERELKVPYYLMFYPDNQELTLYRLRGRKYVSVKPNEQNRYAVAELEMEIALVDGWVRYWDQGVLLPLPAELLRRAERAEQRAENAEQQIAREREARLALERELEELRRQLKRKSKPS